MTSSRRLCRGTGGALVVVFGSTGFLGRYVVRTLALRGYRVRLAVRSITRSLFLKPAGRVGQIEPVLTNIGDEASLSRSLEGADFFVNAVGCLFEGRRGQFRELHVEFPERLSRCGQRQGCLLGVHISAIGASLDHPSAYARTKADGEAKIRSRLPDVTIVRPSLVFGAEDRCLNVLGYLARSLPILPFISTEALFQPVYVGDVAQAICRILDERSYQGKTYELGGPRIYSLRDMASLVLEMTDRRRFLLPIPFWTALFVSKILGWLPRAPLTPDQVHLLQGDCIAGKAAAGSVDGGLVDLGVGPHAFEDIAPSWFSRFRAGSCNGQNTR